MRARENSLAVAAVAILVLVTFVGCAMLGIPQVTPEQQRLLDLQRLDARDHYEFEECGYVEQKVTCAIAVVTTCVEAPVASRVFTTEHLRKDAPRIECGRARAPAWSQLTAARLAASQPGTFQPGDPAEWLGKTQFTLEVRDSGAKVAGRFEGQHVVFPLTEPPRLPRKGQPWVTVSSSIPDMKSIEFSPAPAAFVPEIGTLAEHEAFREVFPYSEEWLAMQPRYEELRAAQQRHEEEQRRAEEEQRAAGEATATLAGEKPAANPAGGVLDGFIGIEDGRIVIASDRDAFSVAEVLSGDGDRAELVLSAMADKYPQLREAESALSSASELAKYHFKKRVLKDYAAEFTRLERALKTTKYVFVVDKPEWYFDERSERFHLALGGFAEDDRVAGEYLRCRAARPHSPIDTVLSLYGNKSVALKKDPTWGTTDAIWSPAIQPEKLTAFDAHKANTTVRFFASFSRTKKVKGLRDDYYFDADCHLFKLEKVQVTGGGEILYEGK